jgi:hypothetical protein
MWSKLTFGKHDGKTLPQVILTDPDWFFWAIEKRVFDNWPALRVEANDILQKARRIKIPKPDPENWRSSILCSLTENSHASKSLTRPDLATSVRVLPLVILT